MDVLGKIVHLRAIEEEDLKLFHKWGQDPSLWRLLGGWNFPSSQHATKKWFENLQGDKTNLRLAITTEEHGVVGLANILNIDWKNKNAFHGMMLGDAEIRGKGIGVDTVMAIMRYAFDELGLHRLDGSMIEFNEHSLKLYCNKCGWKIEGHQRDWYYREGRHWNRIMVGVTVPDYHELIKQNKYWD